MIEKWRYARKTLLLQSLAAISARQMRLIGTAEKLLFNIGRIPARQSRQPVLRAVKRQILPPGRKGGPCCGSVIHRPISQAIEI
jgi:hypothetical protein